ncbi:MAG: acyl-CoA dehydrogenase family protein [Euryarchaeota archaeon]|nr:acyl-CoA dehydrogenase family protein [Euryarchaeota archaeon]
MFDFTKEQTMARKMFRDYLTKEIQPMVPRMEEQDTLTYEAMRKIWKTFGVAQMIRGGWESRKKKAAEKGGDGNPEAVTDADLFGGGAAQDPTLFLLLFVEISRVDPGLALSLGASLGLCGRTIMAKGTLEQKEKYGLPILTLDKIGCWGLTEPATGSNAFALQSVAKVQGDKYILNGSKTLITNAPYADTFVVYAKIDHPGSDPKERKVHGFILERGMDGLETGKPFKKMGMRTSPTGEIFMNEVTVTRDNLLGGKEKDPSRTQAISILEGERSGAPAMALGVIERCIDECVKYSKERTQFGRPIAEYQLVQKKLARMYMHRENVKNLMLKQVWMMKNNVRNMTDACAAKLYCGQAAEEVCREAIQIFGGYGFLSEYPVEKLSRDIRLLALGGGTDEIQEMTIARELLREGGPPL